MSLQPHHAMLSLPMTTKPKRRTVHVALSTINKKLRTSPDQIHIRELAVSVGGLGCAIWDGSIVLARWMHEHSDLFRDGVGLELGAGVGVPGIVAARYAKKVVLTDYVEEVVDNLAYNLKLNSNVEQDEEDDEERDPSELERRRALRQNVRSSGSSAMIDWHAIDPDEEDLARMKAASSSSSTASASTPASASASASSSPSSLESHPHLAQLPFTPSIHFTDETGLGPGSCDFIVGAELIYTYNKHHQDCFLKILQYYLRPLTGRYYCVQSRNREGMPEFVEDLLAAHFTVYWQQATSESGLTGAYRLEKQAKGFVQREEDYVFYLIQQPNAPSLTEEEIRTYSLKGGRLTNANDIPVPKVTMLRDGADVVKEMEQISVTAEGEKLVQQLLPNAFK